VGTSDQYTSTHKSEADRTLGEPPVPVTALDQLSFDPGVPNIARIYDALLGGKDHYEADRRAAAELMRHHPQVVAGLPHRLAADLYAGVASIPRGRR
jgi:S-adenosyl methyltransferase